jgi:hypothetical protein
MNARIDLGLRILIVANILVVGLLAFSMVADWMKVLPPMIGTATPSAPASPTAPLMEMGLAHIPTSAECVLCHESGGSAGVKVIPALGHPLAGWTACLVCHTNDELGRKAPGHEGIAESECLNCHKEALEGPPITQAHADLHEACLDCHGDFAHMPTSMVGRNQDECWLCHKPNPSPPPQKPHPDRPDLTCRTCHQASDVGALPIDHALRADDTCVLCHEMGVRRSPLPTPSAGG